MSSTLLMGIAASLYRAGGFIPWLLLYLIITIPTLILYQRYRIGLDNWEKRWLKKNRKLSYWYRQHKLITKSKIAKFIAMMLLVGLLIATLLPRLNPISYRDLASTFLQEGTQFIIFGDSDIFGDVDNRRRRNGGEYRRNGEYNPDGGESRRDGEYNPDLNRGDSNRSNRRFDDSTDPNGEFNRDGEYNPNGGEYRRGGEYNPNGELNPDLNPGELNRSDGRFDDRFNGESPRNNTPNSRRGNRNNDRNLDNNSSDRFDRSKGGNNRNNSDNTDGEGSDFLRQSNQSNQSNLLSIFLLFVILAGILIFLWWWFRKQEKELSKYKKGNPKDNHSISQLYREMLKILGNNGYPKKLSQTPYEYVQSLTNSRRSFIFIPEPIGNY